MQVDLARSIRAYAARDWRSFERANDAQWQALRRRGLLAVLRVMEDLRAHARAMDPSWPTARDREADLENHRRR